MKPVGESDAGKVPDLIEDIILEGYISTDLHESYIVNLYMGKLDALYRGNYKGLNWLRKDEGILACVRGRTKQRVEIDEIQCGFMSGHCVIDAIVIVRHI